MKPYETSNMIFGYVQKLESTTGIDMAMRKSGEMMVFKRQIHEPNSGGCKRCPGGLRHGWIENGDLPIKSADFP